MIDSTIINFAHTLYAFSLLILLAKVFNLPLGEWVERPWSSLILIWLGFSIIRILTKVVL